MHDNDVVSDTDRERRRVLTLLLAGGVAATGSVGARASENGGPAGEGLNNPLLWAVAWKQTAAEYHALCHQAYNLARLQLDQALAEHKATEKPLAVVTDMDDTILHAGTYWGHLINEDKDFFDDSIWDEWIPKNLVTAVPGSLDFFNYCRARGVKVFYVTSRNQGERTYDYALGHLRFLKFPVASEAHLTVFTDTSDKSSAREKIAETHEIALIIGDNLNDYKRDYYVKDVEKRRALMERDRAEFGRKFILLPNPTNGHWVRAIFGDSEPPPTDANRRTLKAAATRSAWDGC